jgi:hypothetical protein
VVELWATARRALVVPIFYLLGTARLVVVEPG